MAAAAVAMAFVMLLATPASAAVWGANWQMNETSGAMRDSSGNNSNSSSIGAGISRNGSSYVFAAPGGPGSRGIITVPDKANLRPGTGTFTIEARLLPKIGDRNIVQKGTYSSTAHQWKMEIVNSSYNCIFKGSGGDQRVGNATGVKNTVKPGVWQTVKCERTPTQIRLVVDGQVRATKNANPGSIGTSGKPVTIGGKANGCGTHCDWYVGSIDYIKVYR